MSAIQCRTHPDYAVKVAPTLKCRTCRAMWERKHARRTCARPGCGKVFCWHRDRSTRYCSPDCAYTSRWQGKAEPQVAPTATLTGDRAHRVAKEQIVALRSRYEAALARIEALEKEQAVVVGLRQQRDTTVIKPTVRGTGGEATAVLVASDWHIEENVGDEVGGLNLYNLDIAKQRAERFFQNGLRLITLLQQDISIPTVILALLGDFITNDIYPEFPDVNEQQPMHALVTAQGLLEAGIQFLLDHSEVNLIIPCHSGNHARTTQTTRFSSESGHSLEYLMYLHLADHFHGNKRVQFLIPKGIHSYVQVYDMTIRFQHGHAIKYGGGVGGIFIPAFKAIAAWNKAKHADLDVFGHFHQSKDGGNFLTNGSLIGYNAFALSLKADFEPPRQLLFLVDRKRGRTCTWPVLLND